MIDVDEVYKLKHEIKPSKEEKDAEDNTTNVKVNEYKSLPIDANFLCELKSKQINYYHRHLDQCFIRGDNVVLVAYAD